MEEMGTSVFGSSTAVHAFIHALSVSKGSEIKGFWFGYLRGTLQKHFSARHPCFV